MDHLHRLLAGIYATFLAPDRDKERGDVPGWVMITVMSGTVVAALTAIAVPQFGQMLQSAINKVQ